MSSEFGFSGNEIEPSFSKLWQQSPDTLNTMLNLMRRTRVEDSKLQDFRDKRSQIATRPRLRRLLLIAGVEGNSIQVASRLGLAFKDQDVGDSGVCQGPNTDTI